MDMISNYMRDKKDRHMLNELTRKTFGFDFERWVTGGYFEGDYIPYSFADGGKIISNVSVNLMRFIQNGAIKNYIQIGTVMTDESFRKQGLAAKLMKQVFSEYESNCDGIYLFGNLSATDFYEKLGFRTLNQYRYFIKKEFCCGRMTGDGFVPVKEMDSAVKIRYPCLVRKSACHSSFEQLNKYGLQMFYTSSLDNVYYAEDIDCFIVMEQDDGTVLKSVLCKEKISLADVLRRMDIKDRKCRLGFTPLKEDMELCFSETYDGADDYRLFYKGSELESIEKDNLYFPDLSHA